MNIMRSKMLVVALMLICKLASAQSINNQFWEGSVTFPYNFQVGDYKEFIQVSPMDAGSSGNYEISISYTRGSVAASGTHLASISHSNPELWREVGRVNSNDYVGYGHNFTVDCNTQSGYSRFRIRAIQNMGSVEQDLTVHIKIRSINYNYGWAVLNASGNDLTVNKFLAMTDDWSLYVGQNFRSDGAAIAIKAIANGNVGIGTATPKEKLSVNGKIRAHEIKVETANWPDYVFAKDYQLPSLAETAKHIKEKGYLPGIPSAEEVKNNGIDLGGMNAKLLQKIEELTLHLIDKEKDIETLKKQMSRLEQLYLKTKNK
jgi:hypothetical protein